ncbi:DUF5694 domain-containing protein [Anditalea andensis]|uniref:Haem-binding uptake Tiki superfamily ChaN domain-containing protein n=1 Tax=Anditalea andensis TaxID=1048983 RepID=A0A074L2Y1_9BACT|nr:DUF5694 domain-containing protein [Anditalea andensis]KEO74223.1 hypothetical protein EL17_08805 [Anditalea andensis]
MQKIFITALFVLTSHFTSAQDLQFKTKFDDAIPVLNFGTFHMGYTPDASTTEFDEHDDENVRQVHEIAKMLAKFKPTVIVVETTAAYQEKLEKLYWEYLDNPDLKFDNPNEIELLAYEVGRLSNSKRIYGVDHKEGYNYMITRQLENPIDSTTFVRYSKMMEDNEKNHRASKGGPIPLKEMLAIINHPLYLDFLININADILTYSSTKGNAEGADEAAKYYHRNLVMYSHLNQIELNEDDRVFILMGASHTAFFNEFIKRSPKYKLVNVHDYLKQQ